MITEISIKIIKSDKIQSVQTIEKENQKKVALAITDFVFKGDASDIRGMGKEAKSILDSIKKYC